MPNDERGVAPDEESRVRRPRQSGEATRTRIVEAARQVMTERGLAHATTKEIARAAGYSEATLYKHFEGKLQLFLAVLAERLPGFAEAVERLEERPGEGDVGDNLTTVARAAIDFYEQSFPIAASLFAEPELLHAHVAELRRYGDAGPHHANRRVAAYLRAEQGAGRIAADADPEAAAATLVGACFQHAFLLHFAPPQEVPDATAAERAKDEAAAAFAASVARGLR